MPFLPANTAVVVEVGPCIDDTDFKALETAIAYGAAGMSVDLIQSNGTNTTKTDLTLTTGGANDWTHVGNAVYEIELTAAQNNIKGSLRVTGLCTGVLPFESPVYTVLPADLYAAMMSSADELLDFLTGGMSIASRATVYDRARLLLKDTKAGEYRWPDTTMAAYLADALRELDERRPDLRLTDAGAMQSAVTDIPDGMTMPLAHYIAFRCLSEDSADTANQNLAQWNYQQWEQMAFGAGGRQ